MKDVIKSRRAIFVSALLTAAALMSACSSDANPAAQTSAPAPGADAVSADQVEIVTGVPDQERDPAIIAIDIGEVALCTGTLIASNLVLTARHCVATTSESVDCPATKAQVGANRSPASLQVLIGDNASTARLGPRGKEILAPKSTSLCDEDIALIVLDQAVEGVTPLEIRKTGIAVGDHIRSVGFGRAGDNEPAGVKLLREHVRVQQTSPAEFVVGEATCQGDSGGPALDEDSGEIVGVVSRGGPTCDGANVHNIYTRTDAFLALIDEALEHAAASGDVGSGDDGDGLDAGKKAKAKAKDAGAKSKKPTSDLGGTCKSAGDCSAGVCVSEHGKKYCSRSCDTHDRCPAKFACKMDTVGTKVCVEN